VAPSTSITRGSLCFGHASASAQCRKDLLRTLTSFKWLTRGVLGELKAQKRTQLPCQISNSWPSFDSGQITFMSRVLARDALSLYSWLAWCLTRWSESLSGSLLVTCRRTTTYRERCMTRFVKTTSFCWRISNKEPLSFWHPRLLERTSTTSLIWWTRPILPFTTYSDH